MSIVDAIGMFLTSGGITGILGSVVGAVTQYKQRKLELAHEEKSWSFEVKMHQLNADSRKEQMQAGLEAVRTASAAATLTAAINADGRETALALARADTPVYVIVIRTLFRPFLTTLLFAACVMILFLEIDISSTGNQTADVLNQAFMAMLGLWSGSRLVKNVNG